LCLSTSNFVTRRYLNLFLGYRGRVAATYKPRVVTLDVYRYEWRTGNICSHYYLSFFFVAVPLYQNFAVVQVSVTIKG